jgi:hypothetical protein
MAFETINGEYFHYVKLIDGTPGSITPIGNVGNPVRQIPYLWDPGTLSFVVETTAMVGGGGGGGGGPVSVADGADDAQGSTTDAAYTSGGAPVTSLLI